MLDINLIREKPDLVRQNLSSRQMDPGAVDQVLLLDQQRRETIQKVEALKAKRNSVSKEIGRMKEPAERQAKIESMRQLSDDIARLDEALREIEGNLNDVLAFIPNIPDPRTPLGASDEENVVIHEPESVHALEFEAKAHWDLGPALGIINFEQGVKITGSRFYVLHGAGARLQRALIAWMLDLHIRQGYTEVYTPFMAKRQTLFGSGQLPKFDDNLYRDYEDDLYMVPTAEVTLTGLHMDEILDGSALPKFYTAYTPCFRREKISAGRDVRGIKRGHQFDKVEMYIYCLPEDSERYLEKMRRDAEDTCAELGLAYRVKAQCTGDLGFAARITYDIETWAPGCGEWLEVSSISNVGDFQARRANIKYRPVDGGRVQYLHTLNGSGLGMPRTLISVLENYQQEDGSVVIPKVLRPWMGGIEVIRPES
jgi:seryl-tRNA synthetase